jgi:hypothetical protein
MNSVNKVSRILGQAFLLQFNTPVASAVSESDLVCNWKYG